MNKFEFVTIAGARARQLEAGCTPKVDGSPKKADQRDCPSDSGSAKKGKDSGNGRDSGSDNSKDSGSDNGKDSGRDKAKKGDNGDSDDDPCADGGKGFIDRIGCRVK